MSKMLMSHHYEILGLPITSTKGEIKRRYHELAHRYHPDKNDGDDFMFKRIADSYQALKSSTWTTIRSEMRRQKKESRENSATTPNEDPSRVFCNDAADFFWTEDDGGIVRQWWGAWPRQDVEEDNVVHLMQ